MSTPITPWPTPPSLGEIPVNDPAERKRVLAASAPWLAAVLNVLPGLGTGYIYQRRWKAYWVTASAATLWLVLEAWLASSASDEVLIGRDVSGLAGLALLTAVEAFLAARRARMN